MEKDEITLLLEKYWKAETTIAEEKAIKEYFAKHEPGAQLEEDVWFEAIRETKGLQPKDNKPAERIKIANKHTFFKIAASIIVIFGIGLGAIKYYYHAQAEKKMAVQQQIKNDLIFIADALNQGNESLKESQQVLLSIKPLKK